jgi:hypothetical protein
MGYKNNNFYFLQVNKKGSPRVAFFYALKKKGIPKRKTWL